MFCHKCGSQLVDDASFCSVCGTKVKTPDEEAVQPVTYRSTLPTLQNSPTPAANSSFASQSNNERIDNHNLQADNYYDFICPNCEETLSFMPDQVATDSVVTCPMCDYQFKITFESTANSNRSAVNPANSLQSPSYSNTAAMGWHKFLIYFSIWVSAIGNIIGGILYMTGGLYWAVNPYTGELTNYSDRMYEYYEGLQGIDIIMGIAFISTGVLLGMARNALANYKESGPKLLMVAYGSAIADNLLYTMFISSIIDSEAIPDTFIISLIGSLVMTVINYVYYKNRDYMFCN
ncbi:MAG: zinc-ribbon domain-containing protein [Clostridia bacterium]|nr:zinc-ribbon domain-containing protein [Clostridia bacterium]